MVGGDGGGDGAMMEEVGVDEGGGLCEKHLRWLLGATLWQC